MSKILILGASGQVGSALSSQLQAAQVPIVRATSQRPQAADQAQLNLASGEGLEAALKGVDRAFLMAPPGFTRQDELLGPVIAAAQQRGLKKLVLMTAMGADADPQSPMRKTELLLENAGLPYHILRPNWFMQNFNTFWLPGILSQGQILLPVGQARGSFIDARDIAAVAATLLQSESPQHLNQAFNLTGAEALDHEEVAAILTEVSGKPIGYLEIAPEQMRENLLQAGLPADYTEFLLLILSFFKQGFSAAITSAVADITGKPPISFREYAHDYRSAWL